MLTVYIELSDGTSITVLYIASGNGPVPINILCNSWLGREILGQVKKLGINRHHIRLKELKCPYTVASNYIQTNIRYSKELLTLNGSG